MEAGANTATHSQVRIDLRMCSGVFLTFPAFVKADPDTSQQVVASRARILAAIPSLERPGTNRRLRHPVPRKADTLTRSRGVIDTNLPLLLDSRLNRLVLLHQPRSRVMSSPM